MTDPWAGPAPPVTIAVLCADDGDMSRPPSLDDLGPGVDVRHATAATLPGALRGADVLFVWDFLSTAVEPAWPAAAGHLRWVHVASAGVDRLLFPGLVAGDTVLTNSRGVFDRPIAEYVLTLLLAFAKDLPATLDLQRAGTWRHRETERLDGREVLIVGTGSIGRATARLLRAVGLRVSGVGRTARPDEPDFGQVHAAERLHEVLPRADFVVVAAPLTAQTRGMFDAAAFGRMKRSARFVNVGRGALVVEEDLLVALRSGRLGGAGLDVFAEEPLPPGHPFWQLPQVIVSPHMSGDFVGWLDALTDLFARNYRRWRQGEAMLNVVDKTLGYVPSPAR
ncbi:MAG: D-2-hydroxyacid dehydrogenase [Carbonactinosporaceae bacterium]